MARYKLCFLSPGGKVMHAYEAIFIDDYAAIKEAKASDHAGQVEVWQSGRYVETVGWR